MSTNLFCQNCSSILVRDLTKFKCNQCFSEYEKKDVNSMISQSDKTEEHILILHFQHDVANPSIFQKCINCKAKIVKYILHGTNNTIIFGCPNCDKTFTKNDIKEQ